YLFLALVEDEGPDPVEWGADGNAAGYRVVDCARAQLGNRDDDGRLTRSVGVEQARVRGRAAPLQHSGRICGLSSDDHRVYPLWNDDTGVLRGPGELMPESRGER